MSQQHFELNLKNLRIIFPFIQLIVFSWLPGEITALAWYSDSRQLFSAGGADRSIKVWHNPVGVRASVADLKEKLLKAKSDVMKVGAWPGYFTLFQEYSHLKFVWRIVLNSHELYSFMNFKFNQVLFKVLSQAFKIEEDLIYVLNIYFCRTKWFFFGYFTL